MRNLLVYGLGFVLDVGLGFLLWWAIFSGVALVAKKIRGPADPKKYQRHARTAAGVVAVLLGILSLQRASKAIEADNKSSQEVGQAVGATTKLSEQDADLIIRCEGFTKRWNATVGPMVAEYIDPKVSAEAWSERASNDIPKLIAISSEFRASVLAMSDSGIRATYMPFVDNYDEKIKGLLRLHRAVVAGDLEAESDAQQAIQAATDSGNVLAGGLLERLRPLVDPVALDSVLQASHRNAINGMYPKQR